MKKGDLVPIKKNGNYGGQGIMWTEQLTGIEITSEPIRAYHYSDYKLKEFRTKNTCFFDSKVETEGYVYEIIIPPSTEIFRFSNEIRVHLEEEMKIRYIGQIVFEYDYTNKGRIGKPHITVKDNTLPPQRRKLFLDAEGRRKKK